MIGRDASVQCDRAGEVYLELTRSAILRALTFIRDSRRHYDPEVSWHSASNLGLGGSCAGNESGASRKHDIITLGPSICVLVQLARLHFDRLWVEAYHAGMTRFSQRV